MIGDHDRQKEEPPMRVQTVARPYTLTFQETRTSYPLSSVEAQRLIDNYPVISATRNRVVLRGDGTTSVLTPATLGGGNAFVVEK
jgi:hypothetical protein